MKSIEHKGIIEKVDGGIATVKIECASACGNCQAKGLCGESKDKFIDVPLNGLNVEIGDNVVIQISQSQGIVAVVLGYVVPFFVFMVTLIAMLVLDFDELISGVSSLAMVCVYYLCIYLFRNKIGDKFVLIIK